jgi:hypothetical protein
MNYLIVNTSNMRLQRITPQHRLSVRKRSLALLTVAAAACFLAPPALGQNPSQRLFQRMLARVAADDSLRAAWSFSYDLHLAGKYYLKNDSAQVLEAWHIAQTRDSLRAQRLSRRDSGEADVVKRYEAPVKIESRRRGPNHQTDDPLTAVIWELLNHIKKDSKAQLLIDGETSGRDGATNCVVRFLAKNRSGSLWINAQSAALERIEWAYGKSIGFSSSGEKSMIELAPVIEATMFPIRLVFNERARTLLRRSGTYTEIEVMKFHRENIP